MDGVKSDVIFMFNQNNVLEAIRIILSSDRKYEVKHSLESKYEPFMANSNMYNVGNTHIYLYEYASGFGRFKSTYHPDYITVVYMSRAFSILVWKYDKKIEKENDRNKQKQRDLL